jgi:hypothetical protein
MREKLKKIFDGNHNNMVSGYVKFVRLLEEIKEGLKTKGVKKPACGLTDGGTWRASEIERSLFCWARSLKKV